MISLTISIPVPPGSSDVFCFPPLSMKELAAIRFGYDLLLVLITNCFEGVFEGTWVLQFLHINIYRGQIFVTFWGPISRSAVDDGRAGYV